jgi:hypothetical protein
MRYLFAALFGLHGLLHLIGLQWGRRVGVVWILAALALLAGAALLALDRPHWWMVAGAALLLSQALIISHWSAARAGTVVNLLLAIPVILAAGQDRFRVGTDEAVNRLLARVHVAAPAPVASEELTIPFSGPLAGR